MNHLTCAIVACVSLIMIGCYAPPVQNVPYGSGLALFDIDEPYGSGIAAHPESQLALMSLSKPIGGNLLLYPALSYHAGEAAHQKLSGLPGIQNVWDMNIEWTEIEEQANKNETSVNYRQVLIDQAKHERADLLLLYDLQYDAGLSFFTFLIGDLISFGYAPTVLATAKTTLQAILIDVNNNSVLTVMTSDGNSWRITNMNSAGERLRQRNRIAADEAITEIFNQLADAWPEGHKRPPDPEGVKYDTTAVE